MTGTDELREGWEHANDRVRGAEEELAAVWAGFVAGGGGPPCKDLLDEVARQRRRCDERLAAVLGEFEKSLPP